MERRALSEGYYSGTFSFCVDIYLMNCILRRYYLSVALVVTSSILSVFILVFGFNYLIDYFEIFAKWFFE